MSGWVLAASLAVLVVAWSTAPRRHVSVDALPPAIALALWLAFAQFTISVALPSVWFGIGGMILFAGFACWLRRKSSWQRPTMPRDGVVVGLGIVAMLALALSLPIVARPHVSYDVLSYHLPLADRASTWDWSSAEAGNYYARLPLGGVSLEAAFVDRVASPPNDDGVRVFIWVVFVACVFAVGNVARAFGANARAAAVAMALVAWHPLAWKTLLNGYTDGLVALYALAAVWFWRRRAHRPASGPGFPLGVVAGSAAMVKFSAVGVVVAPLMVFVVAETLWRIAARRCLWKQAVGRVLMPCVGILVAMLPWLSINHERGRHLLHPFFGTAPGWSAEQAAFLLNEHDPRSVLYPEYWRGLVEGLWVFDVDLWVGGAVLMPVALMLATAAVFVVRRRWPVVMVLMVAEMGYCAWRTVGLAPDRFVMAPVFLVMILAAMAAWPRRAHMLWRVGAGGLLLVAWMATVIPNRDLYRVAWVDEAWSREGMVPQRFLDSVWKDVGEDDRVLLLFEARARLFPRQSEMTTVWDVPPWFALLREAKDAAAFERALVEDGYSHLVVNEVEWGRLVDFYGDIDRKIAWDAFSVGLRPADIEELLRAYPPMKHANATDAEIARLAEWLRAIRERAAMVQPMGARAELWWAPINASRD